MNSCCNRSVFVKCFVLALRILDTVMLVICLSLLYIFGLYICRSLSSALLHSCFCYSSLVGSRFLPCIYFFLAVAPICRATREYRLPFLYNCMSKDRHALAILSTLIACVLRGWPLRLPCAFYSSHTSFILLNPSHLAQVITRRTIHRPRQSI